MQNIYDITNRKKQSKAKQGKGSTTTTLQEQPITIVIIKKYTMPIDNLWEGKGVTSFM